MNDTCNCTSSLKPFCIEQTQSCTSTNYIKAPCSVNSDCSIDSSTPFKCIQNKCSFSVQNYKQSTVTIYGSIVLTTILFVILFIAIFETWKRRMKEIKRNQPSIGMTRDRDRVIPSGCRVNDEPRVNHRSNRWNTMGSTHHPHSSSFIFDQDSPPMYESNKFVISLPKYSLHTTDTHHAIVQFPEPAH